MTTLRYPNRQEPMRRVATRLRYAGMAVSDISAHLSISQDAAWRLIRISETAGRAEWPKVVTRVGADGTARVVETT